MIIPAIITPRDIAIILFNLFSFKNQAIKLPVQAPVPGKGTATNSINATYSQRPTFL